MKCKGPIRPILMMRKSGLLGPMFQRIAPGVCAKSVGAFYDVGSEGYEAAQTGAQPGAQKKQEDKTR